MESLGEQNGSMLDQGERIRPVALLSFSSLIKGTAPPG